MGSDRAQAEEGNGRFLVEQWRDIPLALGLNERLSARRRVPHARGLLGIKPMSQDVARLRASSGDDVKMLKRIHGIRRKKSISVSRCGRSPHFQWLIDTIPESLPISTLSANDARHRGGRHLSEGDLLRAAEGG